MSQSLSSVSAVGGRPAFARHALVSLVGGALLGAVIAALSPGSFWNGWLAAGVLSALSLLALISAWAWAAGAVPARRRLLAVLIALAFGLRLLVGVGISLALPIYGYDKDCQKAGYLFKDACARDREAFSIAQKGEGLFWFSGITLDNDQYGGLSFLSGWVYRYLSPDAHRPFLILILGAAFSALGVPFLYRAILLRWQARVAALAAWIYVLYPDAIYFGASQMREPFLVGLSGVAFWAAFSWEQNLRRSLLIFALAVAGMAFFSFRVALIMAGVLAVWFWLEYSFSRTGRRWLVLGWLGLAAGILGMALFTWSWFRSSAGYDIRVTMQNSGQVQQQFSALGERFVIPVVTIYGIAQPVLPAAVAEVDALPLARGISVLRALGWYALAPFLLYGLFGVWREPDPRRKRVLLWLGLAVVFWLVIASLRGGGDATDNPRYRSLFIPWMALLAAWIIDWSLAHRDAWLWRWIMVEAIFLGFFTHWYLGRNFKLWVKMPFWTMVIWIIGLSGLVLVGGWLWDRSRLRAGKA
jgi:hypothetical protein